MKNEIKKAVFQLLETPGFSKTIGFKYKKGDTGKTFDAFAPLRVPTHRNV